MIRYKVIRGLVKWRGTVYYIGDFMPDHFTAYDRARTTYTRRLTPVEILDEPLVVSEVETVLKPQAKQAIVPNTVLKPATPKPLFKPTGTKSTPLQSILKAIKKEA